MKGFCPHCEKEIDLKKVILNEDFNIRGENITLEVTYLECAKEGHLFTDPTSDDDPLDRAYREYRRRKNLLQPEEILDFRTHNGLSQRELNSILGWGGATLSRYENGALQSEAHDRLLRLAMKPSNLLDLIESNRESIPSHTVDRLLTQLRVEVRKDCPSLRMHFEHSFSDLEPDELGGYIPLDLDKLINVFLFFCHSSPVVKTKMNKLLFYADFKHFKEYGISITGARYAHLPYGPTPHLYELLLALLHIDDASIALEEEKFGEHVGEVCVALRSPDISIFSTSELKILAEVAHHFADTSATEISELSHQEKGYLETNNGQIISYTYADDLSI